MKKYIYIYFTITFSFCNFLLQAQNNTIDSLLVILKTAKEDTNKVNILNQLSEECVEEDIMKYAVPALKLSEKLDFKRGEASALFNIAYIKLYTGNLSDALVLFEKALEISKQLEDKQRIASIYNNMGSINMQLGNISKGLFLCKESLKMFEEIGNKLEVAAAMNNIAIVYNNLGDVKQSLEWHQKNLKILETEGSGSQIGASIMNIASIYLESKDYSKALEWYEKGVKELEKSGDKRAISTGLHAMGVYYTRVENYDNALKYYNKGLAIQKEINYKQGQAASGIGIGYVFEKKNDLENALILYTNSYLISEETKDKKGAANALMAMTNVYYLKKQYSEVEKYGKKALEIGYELGFPHEIQDAAAILSNNFELMAKEATAKGNTRDATKYYKQAFEMKTLHYKMKDSLNNDENHKALIKQQIQYEFEKKEAIAKLEQEKKELAVAEESRKQKIIILAIVIALIVFGIGFYYRQKLKQKITLNSALAKEKEKQIKMIVEATESERKKIAKELHDSVGALMATTKLSIENLLVKNASNNIKEELQNTFVLIDKATSEVRSISHQMASRTLNYFGLTAAIEGLLEETLLKIGINVQFKYTDFEKRFNENVESVLYRVTQEAIANIIKHSKASNVEIELVEKNKSVFFSIKDNGIGFDSNNTIGGIGIENMKSRINSVNGVFSFTKANRGTLIKIEIPV